MNGESRDVLLDQVQQDSDQHFRLSEHQLHADPGEEIVGDRPVVGFDSTKNVSVFNSVGEMFPGTLGHPGLRFVDVQGGIDDLLHPLTVSL